MKTAFQFVIVVFNLVPLIMGTVVAINGASFFVSEDAVNPSFDAQIRVYGIWFTAIFFLSVWMARNIETCGPVLRIVFILVAIAGLSRFYSMAMVGEFPPRGLVGAILEIATLGFIPWHAHVRKKMRQTSAA